MASGSHMLARARRASEVFRFIRVNSPAYARRALKAPPPFANLLQLLQQDLAAIEKAEA
jgi:hypothetical protein